MNKNKTHKVIHIYKQYRVSWKLNKKELIEVEEKNLIVWQNYFFHQDGRKQVFQVISFTKLKIE